MGAKSMVVPYLPPKTLVGRNQKLNNYPRPGGYEGKEENTMAHNTITVDMVHNFAWYEDRRNALKKVNELKKQGIPVYCGGKRAKSKFTYLDIKTAAIYHNRWNGSGLPWVVAW